MLTFRKVSALRTILSRSLSRGAQEEPPPIFTYDDRPQILPNYKYHHSKQQKRYNKHFVLGTTFLAVTILFGFVTGMFYFYGDIPEVGPPISDYKSAGNSSEAEKDQYEDENCD